MTEVRWLIDPYREWLAREQVLVLSDLAVQLSEVETKPWPRINARGAVIHLKGRGDFLDVHLVDVEPGGTTSPQQHLYESVTYVLEGEGTSFVRDPDGKVLAFDWGQGSLIAIPLNAEYRHSNRGRGRARLAAVTNLPMVINLYRSEPFVFHSPEQGFPERWNLKPFSGDGTFVPTREHRHIWETDFVPDLMDFRHLQESQIRGAGSSNIMFVLADGTLHSHMSEIPVGSYKKAHRHQDGYHIFQLSGSGYSLYWGDGEPVRRVDWTAGTLHGPPRRLWHQHFNTSGEPARYLAIAFGSIRYPYTSSEMESWKRTEAGPDQIEYEDEDPEIAVTFERECASRQAASGEGE